MVTEENVEDTGKGGSPSPMFTTMIRDICAIIKVDEGETENNNSQKCPQINCGTQVGLMGHKTVHGTRIWWSL